METEVLTDEAEIAVPAFGSPDKPASYPMAGRDGDLHFARHIQSQQQFKSLLNRLD
jgi:hypothetical protein